MQVRRDRCRLATPFVEKIREFLLITSLMRAKLLFNAQAAILVAVNRWINRSLIPGTDTTSKMSIFRNAFEVEFHFSFTFQRRH